MGIYVYGLQKLRQLAQLSSQNDRRIKKCIMVILESAAFWIIVAAASEIIALSPLKDNSIVQLVLTALNSIKPKKS